jgi:hypothetical protein
MVLWWAGAWRLGSINNGGLVICSLVSMCGPTIIVIVDAARSSVRYDNLIEWRSRRW